MTYIFKFYLLETYIWKTATGILKFGEKYILTLSIKSSFDLNRQNSEFALFRTIPSYSGLWCKRRNRTFRQICGLFANRMPGRHIRYPAKY